MPKVNKEKMEIFNKLRNAGVVSKDEYDSLTVKQMKKLWDEFEAKVAEMEKRSQDAAKNAAVLEAKLDAENKAKADADAKDKAKADKIAEKLKKLAAEKAKAENEVQAKAKVDEETKQRLLVELEREAQIKAKSEADAKVSFDAFVKDKADAITEAAKHVPQATLAPSQGVITSMPKAAQGAHDCSNCGDKGCRANMEASFTKCIPNSCLKWRPEGAPVVMAAVPDPLFKERDTVLYKNRILAQVQGSYRFGSTYMYRLNGITENQTYETIPENELSYPTGAPVEPAVIPMPVVPKNAPNVRDCKNCGDAVCSANMRSMYTLVIPNSCIKWMGIRKFQPLAAVKYKGKPATINSFYMVGRAWGYTLKLEDGKITDTVLEPELSQ
jgi:hypothetical protein